MRKLSLRRAAVFLQGISSPCQTRLGLRAAATGEEGVQGGVQHPHPITPVPGGHGSSPALLTPWAAVALCGAERCFPGTAAGRSIRD